MRIIESQRYKKFTLYRNQYIGIYLLTKNKHNEKYQNTVDMKNQIEIFRKDVNKEKDIFAC